MRTKRGGVCVISDTQSGQRRARRLGFHPRLKTVRRHRRHDHLLVVVWPSLAATAEGSRQRDDSQQQGFRGSFDERVARLQGSASGGAQRAATDYTHTALCQTSTLRDGCRLVCAERCACFVSQHTTRRWRGANQHTTRRWRGANHWTYEERSLNM